MALTTQMKTIENPSHEESIVRMQDIVTYQNARQIRLWLKVPETAHRGMLGQFWERKAFGVFKTIDLSDMSKHRIADPKNTNDWQFEKGWNRWIQVSGFRYYLLTSIVQVFL